MQLSDFRLKVFLCFILVYLYLQVSNQFDKANAVLPASKSSVKSLTAKFHFFSAFSSGPGKVTILVLAHNSVKNSGWSCNLFLGQKQLKGRLVVQSLGLKNHLSPVTGLWRMVCTTVMGSNSTAVNSVHVSNKRLGSKVIAINVEEPNHRGTKEELGLCLAGPLWKSNSGKSGPTDFISFVEFYRLLGVSGFTVYSLPQARPMQRVLEYYRNLGLLKEVHWNWPERLSHLLGYNGQQLLLQDCLYRNRDAYKYLAFSDLDERLLPGGAFKEEFKDALLPRMLNHYDSTNTSAFGFTNVFFPSKWKVGKKDLRLKFSQRRNIVDIREVTQSRKDSQQWPYGKRSRYVVKPHLVDSLQVHYVNRNQPGYGVRVLNPKEGILAHFRSGVPRKVAFVGHGERDDQLEKLLPEVVARVEAVCDTLRVCNYINLTSS